MASSTKPIDNSGSLSEVRVSTGASALDTILHGGLVGHRPYLIVGPSGTGKTTLALQFLCEGVRHGERVLMVTLEEPPNEMKANHRSLGPELDEVYVFDAIPDVMRYERAPFKDIATVRQSVKFRDVTDGIRKSPELASVEVTLAALEQTIRTEITRYNYSRIVIDSLTALQYFCMKGFDEIAGAQSFVRFLSDLRVTTFLTVEAPIEDVETPERLLARGEIRLFRWELDGRTVRAVGVEKFRGSPHDVRLHPYRIGPQGIDVQLETTISHDTLRELQVTVPAVTAAGARGPRPELVLPSTVGPWAQDLLDLATVGADLRVVRELIQRAGVAAREDRPSVASELIVLVRGEVASMLQEFSHQPLDIAVEHDPDRTQAARRLVARAAEARVGLPPGANLDLASLPSALEAALGPHDSRPVPSLSPAPAALRVPSPQPAFPATPRLAERGLAARADSMASPPPAGPATLGPDLSSAVARLPLTRIDEPAGPILESESGTPSKPATWESPALLPSVTPVPSTSSSSRPALPPPPRRVVSPEYLASSSPAAVGSAMATPRAIEPMVVSAGGSAALKPSFGPPPASGNPVSDSRPPLPVITVGEPVRQVLRPIVIVEPVPAPTDGESRPHRTSRRRSRTGVEAANSAGPDAPPGTAPKRRRRPPSSKSKRLGESESASDPSTALGPLEAPPANLALGPPAAESVSPILAQSAIPAVAKPKRRPARRRKAPPVMAAAAGSPPPPNPSAVSSSPALVAESSAPASHSNPSPPVNQAAPPAPGPTADPPLERRE